MDPQDPQHSPSSNTGKSDTVILRSATPSESSFSKSLPVTEALVLPEWGSNQDAVSWFLQLRKVLKSIIYRYCAAIQKALLVFEENNATSYVHYTSLSQFLKKLWIRWKEFSDTKSITTTFLSSLVIYDDFLGPVSWMTTPRNAAPRFAREMAQLRNTMRQTASELFLNQGLIQDAMARLVEANNGHHISSFGGLPTLDESNDPTEKLEMISLTDPEPESPSTEEDEEDEEDYCGIKDHNLLEPNGFKPIWFQEYGYPGTPPPDLEEYLSSGWTRYCQLIGSIRSIFWLFGHTDLVQLVDDPACLLNDEIVPVPRGCRAVSFLISRFYCEDKIPLYILESYEGRHFPRSSRVVPVFRIPDRITSDIASHCIADLYPFSRPQAFPERVLCLKVKSQKSTVKTMGEVRKNLGESLNIDSNKLLFRGLNMRALALSMSFFIPVVSPHTGDNEFGPGIYAANDFELAVTYACPSGAIMVFKDPDLRGLDVWRPDVSDWQNLTAHWLQIPLDLKVPERYKKADVIIGPLSDNQAKAVSKKCFAEQSKDLQFVCSSYDGCKCLATSLVAIIYLTV